MSDVAVNGRCRVHGTPGTIKFVGSTSFAAGVWIGVELDAELGKNDGSVQGTRYFDSKPNYGVFVRASQCKGIDSPATISAPRSSSNTPAKRRVSTATSSRSSATGSAKSSAKTSPTNSPAPPTYLKVSMPKTTASGIQKRTALPSSSGSTTVDFEDDDVEVNNAIDKPISGNGKESIENVAPLAVESPIPTVVESAISPVNAFKQTLKNLIPKVPERMSNDVAPEMIGEIMAKKGKAPAVWDGGFEEEDKVVKAVVKKTRKVKPPPAWNDGDEDVEEKKEVVKATPKKVTKKVKALPAWDDGAESEESPVVEVDKMVLKRVAKAKSPLPPPAWDNGPEDSLEDSIIKEVDVILPIPVQEKDVRETKEVNVEKEAHKHKEEFVDKVIPKVAKPKEIPKVETPKTAPKANETNVKIFEGVVEKSDKDIVAKSINKVETTIEVEKPEGIIEKIPEYLQASPVWDDIMEDTSPVVSKTVAPKKPTVKKSSSPSKSSSKPVTPSALKKPSSLPSASSTPSDLRNPSIISASTTPSALKKPSSAVKSNPVEIPKQDSAPDTPSGTRHQTVALKEHEDLIVKYKILESKIEADRSSLRDIEKLRLELESSMIVRSKLSEKVKELETDAVGVKKTLKKVETEAHIALMKLEEVNEALEIAAIEQEIAELRVLDMQDEAEFLKLGGVEAPDMAAVAEMSVEAQNERLKEALIILREITLEKEQELKDRLGVLEGDNRPDVEMRVENAGLKKELSEAEIQIAEMKESLDDALGAAEMVEQLSTLNSELSDKFGGMKEDIGTLEILRDVNDELQENHVEYERELVSEIEFKDSLLVECQKRNLIQQELVEDKEATMVKFRGLVTGLTAELDAIKAPLEGLEDVDESVDQKQMLVSMQLQLGARNVEVRRLGNLLLVKNLECVYEKELAELVQAYLPEHFFANEAESLLLFLSFKRIVGACSGIVEGLDVFKAGLSHGESYGVDLRVARLSVMVGRVKGIAGCFVKLLMSCTVECFVKLKALYPEITSIDARIIEFCKALSKDEVLHNSIIAELGQIVPVLERMYEVHGNGQDSTAAMVLSQRMEMPRVLVGRMEMVSDRVEAELNLLSSTFGDVAELGSVAALLVRNIELKVLLKKIWKEIEGDEKARSVEVVERLDVLMGQFLNALEYCAEVVKEARRAREVDVAEIVVSCAKIAERLFGTGEAVIGDALAGFLDIIHDGLGQVLAQLGETNECVEVVLTPWSISAESIKKEYSVNSDLQRKVEDLNGEVVSLIRELKTRESLIAVGMVKIEVLENREKGSGGDVEKVKEEMRVERERYDGIVRDLSVELDAFEREVEELKNRVVVGTPRKGRGVDMDVASPGVVSGDGHGMEWYEEEVRRLEGMVRFIRAENQRMKGRKVVEEANGLFGADDPLMRRAMKPNPKTKRKEVRELRKEVDDVYVGVSVVDLKGVGNGRGWSCGVSNPEREKGRRESVLEGLGRKVAELGGGGKRRVENREKKAGMVKVGRVCVPGGEGGDVLFGGLEDLRAILVV